MIRGLRKFLPKSVGDAVHAFRRRPATKSVNFSQGELHLCNFCAEVLRCRGGHHIELMSCPRCQSNGRERFMYQCVLWAISKEQGRRNLECPWIAFGKVFKRLSILEFSPRNNATRREIYLKTFASYVASDFDLRDHVGDLSLDLCDDDAVTKLSGKFDIILFSHVLEHIPDYRHALENLKMLLSPRGFCILQVPLLEPNYVKVTWDEFHGDKTRVFHRFGFDLSETLRAIFSQMTLCISDQRPVYEIGEVHLDKYRGLEKIPAANLVEFPRTLSRLVGFGPAEFCDAFVLRP